MEISNTDGIALHILSWSRNHDARLFMTVADPEQYLLLI